jgi:hypothetical protein
VAATRTFGCLRRLPTVAAIVLTAGVVFAQTTVSGLVTDPQERVVVGATVKLLLGESTITDVQTGDGGQFSISRLSAGDYQVVASAPGFAPVTKSASLPGGRPVTIDLQFEKVESQSQSVVITAKSVEPAVDLRNAEVFNRTLFTRDD